MVGISSKLNINTRAQNSNGNAMLRQSLYFNLYPCVNSLQKTTSKNKLINPQKKILEMRTDYQKYQPAQMLIKDSSKSSFMADQQNNYKFQNRQDKSDGQKQLTQFGQKFQSDLQNSENFEINKYIQFNKPKYIVNNEFEKYQFGQNFFAFQQQINNQNRIINKYGPNENTDIFPRDFNQQQNIQSFFIQKNEFLNVNNKLEENYMDKQDEFQSQNSQSPEQLFLKWLQKKNIKTFKSIIVGIFTGLFFHVQPASGEISPNNEYSGLISYTEFMEGVRSHVIERVKFLSDGKSAQFYNTNGDKGTVNLFNDPGLLDFLKENLVDVQVIPVATGPEMILLEAFTKLIIPVSLLAGFVIYLAYLSTQNNGGIDRNNPMNPNNMGKSKGKIQLIPDTGVTFDQVAGIDEAKEELKEIVDFLKEPGRYTQLGAKIPRGALLIGPPGTGKTMLAKAVAGEAGVPFISISAAEFIEMFVGVGASRVRDLFKQAKENSPCIIFIDELDAVGRQRAQGIGMGNDEREQTINQILTEMDGFEENKGVIVLAATNIPDVLDKALLRPGRFDRQIRVGLPDLSGRTSILEVHAKNKKLDENVNLANVAKRCLGMSGADLMNVMNEAAIFTARKKKNMIGMDEIFEAIDRIQIGLEKKGASYSNERQKLVAYHEAGHGLLGALVGEFDLISTITIVPRGGAGGVTIFQPNEEMSDSGLFTKEYLENRICVALGGRLAEEIINGPNKVTTGAQNDFVQCTNVAKMMVEQMGMSEIIGPRLIQSGQQSMSQGGGECFDLRNKVDDEIDRIIQEQYERGMKILTDNRSILDQIASTLILKEKISGLEMFEIIKNISPELVSSESIAAIKNIMKPNENQQLKPLLQ